MHVECHNRSLFLLNIPYIPLLCLPHHGSRVFDSVRRKFRFTAIVCWASLLRGSPNTVSAPGPTMADHIPAHHHCGYSQVPSVLSGLGTTIWRGSLLGVTCHHLPTAYMSPNEDWGVRAGATCTFGGSCSLSTPPWGMILSPLLPNSPARSLDDHPCQILTDFEELAVTTLFFLVSLDFYNKTPQTGWLQQSKCIFHSSGDYRVQDEGVGRTGVWWGPFPQAAGCCLLAVSSHASTTSLFLSVHLFKGHQSIPLGLHPDDFV